MEISMKQIALSIDKMKHLESLGLDTSEASMYWVDTCIVGQPNKWTLEVCNENQGFDDWCIPAYTLQDILEKKLPKIIETESDNFECYINLYQNYIDYRDSKHNMLLNVEFGENLLEASYQMILWCIENNYIKTNKELINVLNY